MFGHGSAAGCAALGPRTSNSRRDRLGRRPAPRRALPRPCGRGGAACASVPRARHECVGAARLAGPDVHGGPEDAVEVQPQRARRHAARAARAAGRGRLFGGLAQVLRGAAQRQRARGRLGGVQRLCGGDRHRRLFARDPDAPRAAHGGGHGCVGPVGGLKTVLRGVGSVDACLNLVEPSREFVL
ncbi:MAG: hypothetical protein J3K34DRAFT_431551 [Monoraphidium minutum]|nr:MAG: hypothetical protein J3K34DRAFT_431551 [Monoraphidium minutum]